MAENTYMGFIDSVRRGVGNVVDAGRNVIDQGREAVENVVDAGQNAVENVVETTRDVFEGAVDRGQDFVEGVVDRGQNFVEGVGDFIQGRSDDKPFDGHHVYPDGTTRPPNSPLERNGDAPVVLHVNGITNDVADQTGALAAVEAATGGEAQVIGIHNATEGMLRDLGQAALDTAGKGHNPAVDSLADTIVSELEAGRPVHIMAHSQGGLITSRALDQVRQQLMMEGGMTQEQAEAAMGDIRVESFGSAAPSWPDGPQYVHYVNRLDPVPGALGLGPGIPGVGNPGRDAVVHHFNEPTDFHSFNTTYMDNRVPFEQARNGDFSNPGTDGL